MYRPARLRVQFRPILNIFESFRVIASGRFWDFDMNTGELQSEQEQLSSEAGMRPGQPELPVLKTTGQRIAWLREYYGMSLQDFGRRIGYDGSQISRIERNRCQVVDRFIRVVCIQFRVQESWLREGVGPAIQTGGPAGEDGASLPPAPLEPASAPPPTQIETLTISSQEWQEAWTDLRSYVDLLDKLSPVARAELAAKLHQLVTRVCAEDDADGTITISARLRENDDSPSAPSTADDGSKPRSSKKSAHKPDDGEDWKYPLPIGA